MIRRARRGEEMERAAEDEDDHRGNVEIRDETIWAGDNFPLELVHKILSQIPFPYFYEARLLSRHWHPIFKHFPACAASPLGPELILSSKKWPSYCPAFLSLGRSRSGEQIINLVGLDRTSNSWHRIPSHPSIIKALPRLSLSNFVNHPQSSAVSGALVAMIYKTRSSAAYDHLVVANWLTGDHRVMTLPPVPTQGTIRLFPVGPEHYKVLLLSHNNERNDEAMTRASMITQIYDSRSRTWSACSSAINNSYSLKSRPPVANHTSVLYGDILFCMTLTTFSSAFNCLVLDLKDGTVSKRVYSLDYEDEGLVEAGIFRFGSRIVVVGLYEIDGAYNKTTVPVHAEMFTCATIRVYEFDPVTWKLAMVSMSVPGMRYGRRVVADSDSIYTVRLSYGDVKDFFAVSRFNVFERSWHFHPGPSTGLNHRVKRNFLCFSPGFNPFAMP
ncbi:hypothetical protein Mapa_002186 [Marchantia paleacea]|nr:hypothetical protein Mapa_002186 [Marchantia paleacea]